MKIIYALLFSIILTVGCKDPVIPAAKKNESEANKLEVQFKNNKSRDVWQRPSEVLDLLGDLKGKTVADIGAGTGFFSFRLLLRQANVIAIDIDPKMLEIIEGFKLNLEDALQKKMETRLAIPSDPKIAKNEADVIIIINTIGYIEDRVKYLSNLYDRLPPGGSIMIVDFKSRILPIEAPPQDIRVPLFQMEKDLKTAGFETLESNDSILDYQYIVIGKKAE